MEDGDKNGFFTTRKELWVAELKGQVAGFYCLNYKRGGSVKLGPMITNPSLTGKGIGKAMMSHLLEQVSGERKLYATTNENNHAINSIFDKFGLQILNLWEDTVLMLCVSQSTDCNFQVFR